MKLHIILAAAVLFSSGEIFAQDTTGGTRPTLIIPLHKKKSVTKKTLPQDQPPVLNNTESPKASSLPINADDRKLKRAKKKASRKPQ